MKVHGLARLGRDIEVRYTPSGAVVATLALAFNYGRRGDDGKRPTQWVDASLWGERAESLAPYLKKGSLIQVDLAEVHIETYQGRNGAGHQLAARVVDLELVPNGTRDVEQSASAPAAARRTAGQAARTPAPAPQHTGSGFDDMDDDIPF